MGHGTQLAKAQPNQAEPDLRRAWSTAWPASAEPTVTHPKTAGSTDAVGSYGEEQIVGGGTSVRLRLLAAVATLSVQPTWIHTASQDEESFRWAGPIGSSAAALFAVSGPTLRLGPLAKFDVRSLLWPALGTWGVAWPGARGEVTGRIAATAVLLSLASATALFGLVVIAMAMVTAWTAGRRIRARRAQTLLIILTAALLIVLLLVSGDGRLAEIRQTTPERITGNDRSPRLLTRACSWFVVVVLALAVRAVFSSWAIRHQDRRHTSLLAVRTVAELEPVKEGILHTSRRLSRLRRRSWA